MTVNNASKNNDEINTFLVHKLVEAAKKHMFFLSALHHCGTMLQRPSSQSLDRYVNYWLPLVAEQQQQDKKEGEDSILLIPPADVAWLWHCHRLAPADYERYTTSKYNGRILEANPPFAFQTNARSNEDLIMTKTLWESKYPNKPFFLEDDSDDENNNDKKISEQRPPDWNPEMGKVGGFDLIKAAERQKDFLWQVSGPQFKDDSFLKEGVNKYFRFLQLPQSENAMLVPTYQIDLIWHTHILLSIADYNNTCERLRNGCRFHHDDSFNDRTPGGSLQVAFENTRKLWKEKYDTEYIVDGGMYRGEPPASFYQPDWEPWSTTRSNGGGACDGPNGSGRATSTATASKNQESAPKTASWLPVSQGFKAINEKANRIDKIDGYVFGSAGPLGRGYYSLETREAFQILETEFLKREAYHRMELEKYDCNHCLCLFQPSAEQSRRRDALHQPMEQTRDAIAYVRARAASNGPNEPVPLTTLQKYRMECDPVCKSGAPDHCCQEGGKGGNALMLPSGYIYTPRDYRHVLAAACGGGDDGGGSRDLHGFRNRLGVGGAGLGVGLAGGGGGGC